MSKEVNKNDGFTIDYTMVNIDENDDKNIILFTGFLDNCCYEISDFVQEQWDRYKEEYGGDDD